MPQRICLHTCTGDTTGGGLGTHVNQTPYTDILYTASHSGGNRSSNNLLTLKVHAHCVRAHVRARVKSGRFTCTCTRTTYFRMYKDTMACGT